MQMRKNFRKGIAMIELIFALVILGITLMSAPMLISQALRGSTVTFQQESIAIAAAHTAALMTYEWDESNTIPIAAPNTNILQIPAGGAGDNELDANGVDPSLRGLLPITFPAGRQRRIGVPAQNATAALASDGGDADDIDDFHNNNFSIALASTAANAANLGEYMDTNININTQVRYANDNTNYAVVPIAGPNLIVSPNPTNIKSFTSTLTSAILPDKQIVLNAFMCNVGSNSTPRTGNF